MAETPNTVTGALEPMEQTEPIYWRAQEGIREYIVQNRLGPGAALPSEGALAKQLGISRNSVREAVKALQTLGIIVTRRGSGLFVGDFNFDVILNNLPYGLHDDMTELADLLEVRRVLEIGMVDRVLALVDDAQLEALRHILEQMRLKAEVNQSFPEEDRAFHRELYAHLNNRVLTKLIDIFWLTHHRTASNTDIRDPNPEATYKWHEAIFSALVSGKRDDLVATLDRHYDGIYERVSYARPDSQSSLGRK